MFNRKTADQLSALFNAFDQAFIAARQASGASIIDR